VRDSIAKREREGENFLIVSSFFSLGTLNDFLVYLAAGL